MPRPDSITGGWQHESLRGDADHLATSEFQRDRRCDRFAFGPVKNPDPINPPGAPTILANIG